MSVYKCIATTGCSQVFFCCWLFTHILQLLVVHTHGRLLLVVHTHVLLLLMGLHQSKQTNHKTLENEVKQALCGTLATVKVKRGAIRQNPQLIVFPLIFHTVESQTQVEIFPTVNIVIL